MKGTVWSCGGGTQSAAIAALIIQGKIPKPDLALIADTGREATETWTYYYERMMPALAIAGIDLQRVKGLATVDIYSGKDKDTIIMPMYTAANKANVEGRLPKYCSNEWKTRPIQRAIRAAGYTHGEIIIGFSVDEMQRMRGVDPQAKWNHIYPLVDMRLTRGDCIALVERMGWGTPPRSACWMCPFRTDQEWQHLKDNHLEDFMQAVVLERQLQLTDPDVYFHRSNRPLDSVSFDRGQRDIFDAGCNSGHCFT